MRFNCGCEIKTDENGKPILDLDVEHIRLDCPITWQMICDGNVKGVFQLESFLGKSFAKKVLPRSIEELSDLISIVRPGCIEAIVDGKSLTNHYIDRKHGREDVTYLHPALEPILKSTYGILVYQEQAMEITRQLAGFNLQEADTLRKACGKKKADEMAKVKNMFLTKAKEKAVVSEKEAEEIFSWIEKSQRYSFNKSHGISYAIDGYLSAYCKAHFPREFFTSYLAFSRNESDFMAEVKELFDNAKLNGIDVYPPDIRKRNVNFKLYDDGIYCGLSNVKKVGEAVIKNMNETIKQKEESIHKDVGQWTWEEFLLHLGQNIKKDALQSLISAGALSFFRKPRRAMLYELDKFLDLTDRDISFLLTFSGSLNDRLKVLANSAIGRGKPLPSKKSKEKIDNLLKELESPPYSLEDSAVWISESEQQTIGISLTCSKVDDCDQSSANCTVKDFIDGLGSFILMAVQVDEVKEHVIKNGKKKGEKMAFIKVSDSTCAMDGIILFPESWETCKDILIEGNTVMLCGNRDKKNKETLVINKVWQI